MGEALAALPVARRLRAAVPASAVVLTFTSPSAEAWPGGWPVDRADFLPPDLPRPMGAMLDALRPRLLVFSRADVWPELAAAAMGRDVPVALIGATVRPASGRLIWPVRRLFASWYSGVAYAGAATAADAERLARLGCRSAVLEVTGDPRHDQVLERTTDGRVLRDLAAWAASGEVLVAGSTEPTDEPLLLEAFAGVRRRRPLARLLACPHDPRRSDHLLSQARECGLDAAMWTGGPPHGSVPCLIVAQAGLLADVYPLAALAYVGGGLGAHGVHAVIEPAACAVPVILGPRGHSTDAMALLRSGGAVALPARGGAQTLVRFWETWLDDAAGRARAGLAARRSLAVGAAHRTAARLLQLMAT